MLTKTQREMIRVQLKREEIVERKRELVRTMTTGTTKAREHMHEAEDALSAVRARIREENLAL